MKLTLEQQKANRKLWVEALRSGKYRQTQDGWLRVKDGSMCCLGVLADIAGCTWKGCKADGEKGAAPKKAMEFVGLRQSEGQFNDDDYLSVKNDNGASFFEIADIIEFEPEGLFVESVQP